MDDTLYQCVHCSDKCLTGCEINKAVDIVVINQRRRIVLIVACQSDWNNHTRNCKCLGLIVGKKKNKKMASMYDGVTNLCRGIMGIHVCDWLVVSKSNTKERLGRTLISDLCYFFLNKLIIWMIACWFTFRSRLFTHIYTCTWLLVRCSKTHGPGFPRTKIKDLLTWRKCYCQTLYILNSYFHL